MATRSVLDKTLRKLEQLELLHLRALCAELHTQLERTEQELCLANQAAEMWYDSALMLQAAMDDPHYATHRAIGINKSGETMVVKL